jgi:hypothetical protein
MLIVIVIMHGWVILESDIFLCIFQWRFFFLQMLYKNDDNTLHWLNQIEKLQYWEINFPIVSIFLFILMPLSNINFRELIPHFDSLI